MLITVINKGVWLAFPAKCRKKPATAGPRLVWLAGIQPSPCARLWSPVLYVSYAVSFFQRPWPWELFAGQIARPGSSTWMALPLWRPHCTQPSWERPWSARKGASPARAPASDPRRRSGVREGGARPASAAAAVAAAPASRWAFPRPLPPAGAPEEGSGHSDRTPGRRTGTSHRRASPRLRIR